MTTTKEYVINSEGAVLRRVITEAELDLSDNFIQTLCRDVNIKMPLAWAIPEIGDVGLCVQPSQAYATVSLQRLRIRCPWRLNASGNLIPMFGSNADPVMTLDWTPPKELHPKFLIMLVPSANKSWLARAFWLFALNPVDRTFWRMPIANVHDDCSCCTGTERIPGTSAQDVVRKAVDNFDQANYNSDLWRNAEFTHAFFQIKPLADSKFQMIAPSGNWWDWCTKVGTSVGEFVI